MRIIAGKWRGRQITAGDDDSIRPTTDRMRERLFSILQHPRYPALFGARVADLCAGTGALGLEALSRGASSALFVEKNPRAARHLKRNINDIADEGTTIVLEGDVVTAPIRGCFDMIFADPPYQAGLADPILARVARENWLKPGGVVVLETHKATDLAIPAGLTLIDERRQGVQKISLIMHAD